MLAENGSGSERRVSARSWDTRIHGTGASPRRTGHNRRRHVWVGCVLYETFYGTPAIPGDPRRSVGPDIKGRSRLSRIEVFLFWDVVRSDQRLFAIDSQQSTIRNDVYARLRQFELELHTPVSSPQSIHTADANEDGIMRRQAITTLAGGLLGAVVGGLSIGKSAMGMESIESIAVLRFDSPGGISTKADGSPLAGRRLTPGDALASALVSELSSIDGLRVVPYRPQHATDSSAFQDLGKQWNVDAFLTGSIDRATRTKVNTGCLTATRQRQRRRRAG